MTDPIERARHVHDSLPAGGLFAGLRWRIAPSAFPLSAPLVAAFEELGGQLLAFYRACNVLYRHSVSDRQPSWVAEYLDAGKPAALIELSRRERFKSHIPRVIRPDILLSDDHFVITELDSIPGGIGLTGWLGKIYGELGDPIVGGPVGMLTGFDAAFEKPLVMVVSDEAATYRPEMEWLGRQCGFAVVRPEEISSWLGEGRRPTQRLTVYRFFELFDLANVSGATALLEAAARGEIVLTPPPKPQLEEKLLLALLWLEPLRPFWREHLGEPTLAALRRVVPPTWVVDPRPLPPHALIPGLEIHDWRELAKFSQRQRELVLKISGFHEHAWGSRGVYVGHDLPAHEWAQAVERALSSFPTHPYVLQRFVRSRLVRQQYVDVERGELREFEGRVRLCPYYFVEGDRCRLGGVLATVCPADKKILHGMPDAVLAPCRLDERAL
ncbi:MAG: hypothetical protein RMM51_09045 [Verrucomicrobiae bacterium]|nr:hypothetical protein [Verrucomicrobiae bacterium]